jgi:hypothetical protein
MPPINIRVTRVDPEFVVTGASVDCVAGFLGSEADSSTSGPLDSLAALS